MIHLCTGTGFEILAGLEIHATIFALPAPTHHVHGHEMTYAVVGYVFTDIVLITAVVSHDLVDVARIEFSP